MNKISIALSIVGYLAMIASIITAVDLQNYYYVLLAGIIAAFNNPITVNLCESLLYDNSDNIGQYLKKLCS